MEDGVLIRVHLLAIRTGMDGKRTAMLVLHLFADLLTPCYSTLRASHPDAQKPYAAVQRERVDRKTRGLRQLNEIPTICYLFCCGECDFVSSFKVLREKFDRSGYFLLSAYFSCIRHALFGDIKVSEEVVGVI
ncbi:Uncharacterised protein [Niallia circulans]|nr:hypothetical protein CHH59_04085 [Shouchella clausii]SPU18306.1 Uncharacterised protein [Niallia circulans]